MKSAKIVLLLLLLGTLLLACRSEAVTPANEAGIEMTLEMEPNPAVVGETLLMVGITDINGDAVEVESMTVRGDMNHAGMAPVIREVEQATDGVYHVPFEWSMGGEWIVAVTAQLADGQTVEEWFDLSVSSESMSENENEMDGMTEHEQ